MSERKPVLCPWCGSKMELSLEAWDSDVMWSASFCCVKCKATSPEVNFSMRENAEGAAYAAATASPPNLPLDYKTIYNLTDREPVWRVDKQDDVIVLGGFNAWRKYDAVRYLYFAANPSPADIEAARKGIDCK